MLPFAMMLVWMCQGDQIASASRTAQPAATSSDASLQSLQAAIQELQRAEQELDELVTTPSFNMPVVKFGNVSDMPIIQSGNVSNLPIHALVSPAERRVYRWKPRSPR